ncbi:hypothetical protein BZG36_01595 [Bifiguratus adelaidae]|uniref:MHD domain-containing protein n=1 Tax=Bifiguratus adelaidae TaxID=1938954 RepID=A0A261Y433_9FUNG|nr:hypothetical protein BZG36_01595 [Bifiguratus adelaidae]
MLNSLFVLNAQGKIIIEKHWRGVIPRQVVDKFNDQVVTFLAKPVYTPYTGRSLEDGSATSAQQRNGDLLVQRFALEDLPPVIDTPHYQFLNVQRGGLIWLSPVESEVEPQMIFEFIHRIIDVVQEYLGDVSEMSIRDNFVIVYQLLEEMMDYGYPLTTETSVLKEVIPPPTVYNKVYSTVSAAAGVGQKLPSGTLSSIPWRKLGIKYANNEIYFDVVEEVDAILEKNGSIISAEAHGTLNVNCRLSGMPDLSMTFINPRVIDDVSFHPCVRYQKYVSDKVLSFVPPDGHFKLMTYRVNLPSGQLIPLQVRPQVTATKNGGKFEVVVTPRPTEGKAIEHLVVTISMGKACTGVNASCSMGDHFYDSTNKTLRWEVGKVDIRGRPPTLSGSFSSSVDALDNPLSITLGFQINMYAVSGLKVDSLKIYHEGYKPYKGVRSLTRAGKFQVRT